MEKVVDIPCRAKGNAAGGVDEVGVVGKDPRTVRFSWPNHTGFSESHLLLHAPSSSRESAWLRADTPGNKQAKLP